MAHEQFTADLPAHAPSEQLMAQAHPIELVEALEAVQPLDDLDVLGHSVQRV
ncbi:hypothetical protein D3C80_2039170 [compost metagenome]